LLIVIFLLPAQNLWASPVASTARTERYVRGALSSVLNAGWLLTAQKSDADFGGQRYVKQAEFCGLSEG
jgi:hypothetical protein